MLGTIDLNWLFTLLIPVAAGAWKIFRKLDNKINTLDNIAKLINEADIPGMQVKIDGIEQSIINLCKDQSSIGMKLKFLFENEKQAVFELNNNGLLFWANGSFLSLLGLPDLESAAGSEWLDSFDLDGSEAIRKKIAAALEVHKSFSVKVKGRGGNHISLNAYVIKDAGASLSGWVGVLEAE